MSRLLVLALPLFVGGCFLPVNLTIVNLVANGFSVAATGKGTADHALSAISNQDCSLLRLAKAESVCRADEKGPAPIAGKNVTGAGESVNGENVSDATFETLTDERELRAGTKANAVSEGYRIFYLSPDAATTVLAGAMPR